MLTLLHLKRVVLTPFFWLRCSENNCPQLLIIRLPLCFLSNPPDLNDQSDASNSLWRNLTLQPTQKQMDLVICLKFQADSQQQSKITIKCLRLPLQVSHSNEDGSSQNYKFCSGAGLTHEDKLFTGGSDCQNKNFRASFSCPTMFLTVFQILNHTTMVLSSDKVNLP